VRNPLVRLAVTGTLALALVIASLVVWFDDEPSAADEPPTEDELAAQGEQLFFNKGCAGCHHILDVGGQSMGPDLTFLAERAGEEREGMSAEDYVRDSIRTPNAYYATGASVGPFGMPVIPMTDAELNALVAFLLQAR